MLKISYQISPKNSYKITEQTVFKNTNSSHFRGSSFNIKIIKRFEFSSVHQSNSVIVFNSLDKTYRFYIKGAPEKIKEFCNEKSLPKNFLEVLKIHTQNGYRVLACATKPLLEEEILTIFHQGYRNTADPQVKDWKFLRTKFENNLLFLGFIIVSNKLKSDTSAVISSLKKSNCQILMATGDNPYTSVSVAKQCNLLENDNIALVDIENGHLD